MQPRIFAVMVLVGVASGLYWHHARRSQGEDSRPNVILFVVDTLRADHLHGYGYARETTPNLDQMMLAGVRFEAAIAISSWSAPSHTAIVTGTPTYRHTVFDFSDRIADGIKPLSSVFKAHGYKTGLFSTHLALHSSVGRLTDGLDETVILENQFDSKVLTLALDWSRSQPGPFFLYIVLMGPHAPYQKYPESDNQKYFTDAPPGAEKRYPFIDDWWTGEGGIPKSVRLEGRHDVGYYVNRYDRAVRYTDELIGNFLDGMRTSGLLDHSVLALTSDHGEGIGDHDYFSHEVHLYDFLIRIPLIFVFPGQIPPGTAVDSVVEHVDIAPTLLGLAGLRVPEWMTGRNFSENLREGRPIDPNQIATSTYRLRGHNRYSARSAKYKLIHDANSNQTQFYDLVSDPNEALDLLEHRDGNFPAEIFQRHMTKTRELMQRHRDLEPERRPEELTPEVRRELESLGYIE